MTDKPLQEKVSQGRILVGYIFSILGGFIGIIIAYLIVFEKEHGQKIYRYDEESRIKGKIMLAVAIFMTLFWMTLPLLLQGIN